jgi:RHS repeat-associated protein
MQFPRLLRTLLAAAFFSGTALAQPFEETRDIVLSPNFCSLYPITVPHALVSQAQAGSHFNNVPLGTRPGNYNWLSWAGKTDVNTLAASLAASGNSHTYRNPNNPGDHRLDTGDWVEGTPGVKNGNAVRAAMDLLLGKNIILPVWSVSGGQGANINYQTARFAVVELTDYQLNGKGYISFTFKRFTQCYNNPPTALDDHIETREDKPVELTLTAEDPDNDPLGYDIITQPTHGTIAVDGGQVIYTPAANYNGDDQFTFRVHDNEQVSNIATVFIEVIPGNDPPAIVSSPLDSTPERSLYVYRVQVEDPNLDPIQYQLDRAPAGMTIDHSSGVINWLPDAEFVQTVPSFNQQCYVLSAGSVKEYEEGDTHLETLDYVGSPDVRPGHILLQQGSDGTHQLSVQVSNRGLAEIAVPVDVNFYNGEPESSDLLGSVRIERLDSGQAFLPTITVPDARLSDDIYVTLTVDPAAEECEINNNRTQAALVRVRATDSGELFDTQLFTLNVDDVNGGPEVTSEAPTDFQAGQAFSYSVTTADGDAADAHIFRIVDGPEGLFIDARTGVISAAAGVFSPGTHTVIVEVEDLRGATTRQTFTLTIHANLPPEIVSAPVVRGDERSGYRYDVEAVDLNPGDELTYSVESGPLGLAVDSSEGLANWSPNADFVEGHTNNNIYCVAEPTAEIGQFEPVVKWHWSGSDYRSSYKQVMSIPVVAQLNDDNADGEVTSDDIPDVIFTAFSGGGYENPSMLRALSGADGSEIWPHADRWGNSLHGPAVADIDGDGLVEIVVGSGSYRGKKSLIAYENDGTVKWKIPVTQYGEPSIADLNNDGVVEILVANAVYDPNGQRLWTSGSSVDRWSLAVDLDLDGDLEVFINGAAYDDNGTLLWESIPSNRAAVGNFDGDDYPEIVAHAGSGYVALLEHDGQVKWGPVSIPGGGGGPVTIAEMDGDGEAEIGVAGARYYVVFEGDGTVKWASPTRDVSSSVTGSSVFDFEGDGRAEILYADEHFFRIYDGATGDVLYELPNPSATLVEYPLVVDVDNDNHAEIVLISNNYAFNGPTGVRVLEDANDSWAPTRSIWNQHAYHITNINDDGTVPRFEQPSWLSHNTYRLNTFPDRPALGLPDLTAYSITYDENADTVFVKVKNRGLAPMNSPITVSLVHEHFWLGDLALVEQTINTLGVGEELEIPFPLSGQTIEHSLRVDVSAADTVHECVTNNNSARAALVEVRVYDPASLFDTQKFAVSIANSNDAPEIISAASSQAFAGQAYSFPVEANDPDKGDTFEYSLVDAPDGLAIGPYSGLMSSDGLPQGIYHFTLRVRDVAGEIAEQPHVLTVSPPDNLPPAITSEAPQQATVGEEYRYDVVANDPDGDELVYALSRTQPGMTVDQSTGQIHWTPRASDAGIKTAEVTVVDHHGAAAKQYFLIEVIDPAIDNQPPVITSVPSGVVYAGKTFDYQVDATDPDGDRLSYDLVTAVSGMAISEFGLFSWLPDPGLIGQQVIVDIQVNDGRGGVATQKLTLPVNESANHPPIITSVPALQVAANDPYHYTIEAADQDGDSFSIALLEAPNGMTLSGNLIAWTPSSVQAGQVHNVAILVEDARGAASTQTYGIAVNEPLPPNAAPVINSVPGSLAIIGQEYTYNVIARDADGDSLTYSLQGAPAGMTLNQSGQLRWIPDASQSGLHEITLEVSDGRAWARQRYTLQAAVADDNNYPEITSWPRTLTAADVLYTYQMEATDADDDALSFGALDLPAGMTVTSDGFLQWTPTASQVGIHDVVLFADDGQAKTLQSFTINVTADPLPLNTSIVVTPEIVNAGDSVTINIYNEGGQGSIEAALRIDGEAVPLNPFGQTQIIAASTGVHMIEVSVTDGIDTVVKTATYSVRDPLDSTAPVVNIAAPADDAIVTSPADIIGTVQDANLAHYRVLIAPQGQDSYTEIASGGSNVIDGALGLFDPTLLHNGLYDVFLEATDVNGQLAIDSTTVLVDGDMKVGHFALTFEDLNVDLAGIPIQVTRTYDTRQRAESLDFGHGWSVDYQNVRVQESRTLGFSWSLNYYQSGFFGKYCVEPNGDPIVTVRLPNGDLEKFRARAEPECTSLVPTIDVHIEFEPLEGTRSTLEQTRYGLLRLANGHIVDLTEPEAPVDPDTYRLTTVDGMVYSLNQAFGVRRIDEPGGEFVTYTDDGIQHSQGYAINFERDSANRITAIVTPDGRRTEYTYTASGDLNTVTDMSGDVTRHAYLFRLPHYLEEIVDPRGVRATRMEYDDSGRLLAIIDADGNRVEYEHDIAGNTEIVKDRNGNQTVYIYDDNGRIIAETNALGETITRSYNAVGDVLSETNALGETTSWTYDSRGNRLTETNPLGHTTTFSYTVNGEVLTEVDPLGNVTVSNTYDARSLKLTSTTDALGNTTLLHWDLGTGGGSCSTGANRGYTDAEGNVHQIQPICFGPFAHLPLYDINANGTRTDFEYDSSGRKTAETTTRTDADGNTVTLRTEYQYDAEEKIIATTHPDGTVTRTDYNAIGKVAAEIDALGRRTEFEYDSRGNEALIRYPDGSTETKAYNAEGNLIAETDRGGLTTRYVYDAANRRIETLLPDETPFDDSDNPRTRSEYDGAGRLMASIDANGNRTEYAYDAAGQRTLVRDALGNETRYEYDPVGRRTAMVDARGNRTDFIYDAAGRLSETVFPDGTRRQTAYDGLGRKISETDEQGRTTQYGYDPLGRLIQVTDPVGNLTSFGYDEQGNKISQTDAEGRVTRWTYDDMGRTTSRTLPLSQVETFTYDEAGNRTSHTNFNGATTTYTYDELNREVLRDYPTDVDVVTTYTPSGQVDTRQNGNGLTDYRYDVQGRLTRIDYPGSWVVYAYDAAGNRTLLNSPHSDTHYGFDALNRLTNVTDPDGTTTYRYDAVGNRAGVTFANGVQTTHGYDARNRLIRIDSDDSTGNTLLGLTYALNANGTRAEIQEDSGRIVRYTYDTLDRLVAEATTDAAIGSRTTTWSYDKVGNRLSETEVTASGTDVTSYVYDDIDRLLSETDSTGTTVYRYDDNGNLLEKAGPDSTTTYTWNDDNRLVESTSGSDTVTYTYDSLGIRQSAVRNGVITNYLVDPNRDYAEVIAEEDASGIAQVLYTHADEVVSQQRQGVFSYYHADGLGSICLLTDTEGTQTDSYIYDAFGEVEARTGSTVNEYLFTGEQFDPNLNQYYLRARYYDQSIGRFRSMDTWQGNSFDPVTLHKYLYANADPVNNIDPTGHFSIGGAFGAAAITGVLATTTVSATIRSMAVFAPPGAGSNNWSPDLDGRIDIWEASYWWRNGNGAAQSVPLNSVDLSGVSRSEFSHIGDRVPVNLDFFSHFSNASDAAVYGGLVLELTGSTTVVLANGFDTFDFDQHSFSGGAGQRLKTLVRNIETAFAKGSLGAGQPFDINLTGQGNISP